jgi:NADH-quinone oxidoreductase subunit D
MPDIKTEVMTVNMGPQHPSTHGVLRLVLELDGETVLSAAPTIGYLHTGIEKTAEQKKWQQVIPLVERMDYLSAQSNSMAFCLSVEKLLGIEIPERVRNIRVLLAELQRINSHLVWLGTHGMEVGAVSVMLYCFRERELLLNINELLAGFRLFPSYMRVGGLREDLPRGFHAAVISFLDRFGPKLDEYEDLLTKNEIYLKRTQNVGVISKDKAVAYSLLGPIARAAGVDYDVRKYFPYLGYETYDFVVPTQSKGDVYSRYLVRVAEMREANRIVRQCVDWLRAHPGPVMIDDRKVRPPSREHMKEDMESLIHHFKFFTEGYEVPAGETYAAVEAPKGEFGIYLVSDGANKPYRLKCRAPGFPHLAALEEMSRGHMLADVVAVIGTQDIVFGEIDR